MALLGTGERDDLVMGEWRQVGTREPPLVTPVDKIDIEQAAPGQGATVQAGDMVQIRITPRKQALVEEQSALESSAPWALWLWTGREPKPQRTVQRQDNWAQLGSTSLRAALIGRKVGERVRVQLAEEAEQYLRIPLAGAMGLDQFEKDYEPQARRLRRFPFLAISKMGDIEAEILNTCPGHIYHREATLTRRNRIAFLTTASIPYYLHWTAVEGRCSEKLVRFEVGPVRFGFGKDKHAPANLAKWVRSYQTLRPYEQNPHEYENDALLAKELPRRRLVRGRMGGRLNECEIRGLGSVDPYPRLLPKLKDAVEVFAVGYATVLTTHGEIVNYVQTEDCLGILPGLQWPLVAEPGVRDLVWLSQNSKNITGRRADGTWWYWGHSSMPKQLLAQPRHFASKPSDAHPGAPAEKKTIEFIKYAAGDLHTLVLTEDGVVWSGGNNDCGQLGREKREDYDWKPVQGLPRIVDIGAGQHTSTALAADGTVWVWGHRGGYFNTSATTGYQHCPPHDLTDGPRTHIGEPLPKPTPIRVEGLDDVVVIAQGAGRHGLALKRDGTVWAWGSNDCGQVGVDDAREDIHNYHERAVRVEGLSDIKAIAAGYRLSFALRADGTVWSWGRLDMSARTERDIAAQPKREYARPDPGVPRRKSCADLGVVSTLWEPTPIPVRVYNVENAVKLTAGNNYGLALRADGRVWAFGGGSL